MRALMMRGNVREKPVMSTESLRLTSGFAAGILSAALLAPVARLWSNLRLLNRLSFVRASLLSIAAQSSTAGVATAKALAKKREHFVK